MTASWFAADDYWLGRLVFQRSLAAVYVVAFLVAVNQFRPLLGGNGLLPIPEYLKHRTFRQAPSIFQWHYSDRFFAAVCWAGAALAAVTLAGLTERAPLALTMLVWLVL